MIAPASLSFATTSASFAGTRFLEFAPFSWFASDQRAYLRLIIIGVIILLLVMLRPQGLLGERVADRA